MSTKSRGIMKDWMDSDIREDMRRFRGWVRRKRTAILVVVFWSVALGLIFIKAYYDLYVSNPIIWYGDYKLIYAPTYSIWVPRLSQIDYVLIFAIGLVAGFIIADIETALFGFLASIILSVVIGTLYSSFFIFYVLEASSIFGSSFNSMLVFVAFLSIFRMVFPVSILITFFGGVFGSVIRGFIQPSAQD